MARISIGGEAKPRPRGLGFVVASTIPPPPKRGGSRWGRWACGRRDRLMWWEYAGNDSDVFIGMPKTMDRPRVSANDRRLIALMRCAVREELQEIIGDPDVGLSLRPAFVRRLARRSGRAGKTLTAAEVIKRLRLVV